MDKKWKKNIYLENGIENDELSRLKTPPKTFRVFTQFCQGWKRSLSKNFLISIPGNVEFDEKLKGISLWYFYSDVRFPDYKVETS